MEPLCCTQWEINMLKADSLGWENRNYTKQYLTTEYELWYNHQYLVSLYIWHRQVHFGLDTLFVSAVSGLRPHRGRVAFLKTVTW